MEYHERASHFNYDPLPGFTPVQRRATEYLNPSPALSHLAPWTTARCNRLLRPISSRIALLRKHNHSHSQQPHEACQVRDSEVPKAVNDETSPNVPSSLNPARQKADPDWIPNVLSRKRVKRTYSSKSNASTLKTREKQKPEVLMFPKEFRSEDLPKPAREATSKTDCQLSCETSFDGTGAVSSEEEVVKFDFGQTRDSFRKLAKAVSPSEWVLSDGLYNGLDSLLKATSKSRPTRRRGTQSLFFLCLQKVPSYITHEQTQAQDDEEDCDKDIASLTYNDLESYSSSERNGWRHLREVVRAHGVSLIAEAVRDRSIKPAIARGLIISCMQGSNFEEAQVLCDAFLDTLQPLPPPNSLSDHMFSAGTSHCLQTLHDLSSKSRRWGYFYRKMTSLIEQEVIGIEWLATQDMIECWNRVLSMIARHKTGASDAIAFLRITVQACYSINNDQKSLVIQTFRIQSRRDFALKGPRQPNRDSPVNPTMTTHPRKISDDKISSAITNTMSSLMTILLSITLVSSNEPNRPQPNGAQSYSRAIQLLALNATQWQELNILYRKHNYQNRVTLTRASLPIFSGILAPLCNTKGENSVVDWNFSLPTAGMEPCKYTANILSTFLCSVAHCCDRAGAESAFYYLKRITSLFLPPQTNSSTSLNRVITSAGFEFAQKTNQEDHLEWALELEMLLGNASAKHTLYQQDKECLTPGDKAYKSKNGFRWEEGICEWVARTPAARIMRGRKPQVPKSFQLRSQMGFSSDNTMSSNEDTRAASLPRRLQRGTSLSEISPFVKSTAIGTTDPIRGGRRTNLSTAPGISTGTLQNCSCKANIVANRQISKEKKAKGFFGNYLHPDSDSDEDVLSKLKSCMVAVQVPLQVEGKENAVLVHIVNSGSQKPRGRDAIKVASLPLRVKRDRSCDLLEDLAWSGKENISEDELCI